jgi:hypothetical protein
MIFIIIYINMDICKTSIPNSSTHSKNNTFYTSSSAMMATFIQVPTLMWLRTIVNYQYKNGSTFYYTTKYLYSQGQIKRFYKGFIPALMLAPLIKFGDVYCHTSTLNYINNNENYKYLPLSIKTFIGSSLSGLWRVYLLPLDCVKTSLQVNGNYNNLINKIKTNGYGILYSGSISSYFTSVIGVFPWFYTFNYLNIKYKKPNNNEKYYTIKYFYRYAFIGFFSTMASDIVSNFTRIIKIYKQTHNHIISYNDIIKDIINKDGYRGLFFRGLYTKILTNGIQGIFFTIIWKSCEDYFFNNHYK